MLLEVPRFTDIPTDVTPNLQDRLNGVTDVLARVSKLVFEDLEKAVSAAVGPDEDGNMSPSVAACPPFNNLCCVLKFVIGLQVLLRIRGRSWLWFPVRLLRATRVGRRASMPVSPLSTVLYSLVLLKVIGRRHRC